MGYFELYKTIAEWREAIEDNSLKGLFVDGEQRLILDRRYAEDSNAFNIFGPRTADLNLIGPDRIVVPGDVVFGYISEAIAGRREEQRRIEGVWSH